jgi:hypothetical protein
MSDGSYAMGAGPSGGTSSGDSSMVDTAKEEAAGLTSSATDAAKDVAGTARDEAASVARTTKSEAAELFHQTQREVSDQAAAQQQRLAAGLGAVGEQLGSMARNSEGGLAADLVQRVSSGASSAASWLQARDPSGVLAEVKAFARRRPMAFIGAALVAGVAAGRLTRAMVSEAKEESNSDPAAPRVVPRPSAVEDDSPVYSASAARASHAPEGVTYDRPDSY